MFTSPGSRAGRKSQGLQYWVESYTVGTPNATIPAVGFAVKTLLGGTIYADVDACVIPSGQGGFLAAIPDNSTVGGNKRGVYATDTQTRRSAANMVAGTPYGALIAGRDNLLRNTTANTMFYAGIFAGFNNSILSTGGSASDGNVILGGSNHIVNDTGGGSIGVGILAGGTHTINTSSSKGGQVALGGTNHILSGNFAAALGGRNHDSASNYGVTLGAYARTRGCEASIAHGTNAGANTIGAVQRCDYVVGITTNNATPTVLTANGSGTPSATNQVGAFPSGGAFAFRGQILANRSGSAAGVWDITGGLAINNAGTITIVGAGPTITAGPISAALVGCAVAITADTPNLCLAITVTGIAATTIGWTAHIQTVEHT